MICVGDKIITVLETEALQILEQRPGVICRLLVVALTGVCVHVNADNNTLICMLFAC